MIPNPATNSIAISNITSENYTVEIFSVIGNSVLRVANQNSIDISKLAPGVYMVLVRQGNQTQIQKLIKK
ncbi:MAG: T9SS type A sorting domain-containing protein [Flavobacterium sp.]|nr:T9SS type A sorting domain-containing protein [Flavobacterium sp.]